MICGTAGGGLHGGFFGGHCEQQGLPPDIHSVTTMGMSCQKDAARVLAKHGEKMSRQSVCFLVSLINKIEKMVEYYQYYLNEQNDI